MNWEKHSIINESNLEYFQELHDKKEKDWYNNQFHLTGFCGSTNDPNGLAYFNGQYYIFMQNCPFSIYHYNKSWALYTTTDFINYTYEGITLTPSNKYDKDGVFSGSAYVNKNGDLGIYYTGNIKFNAVDRTSYTLKAFIDLKNKIVQKELLFECDLTKYTGHFRDPVVFEKNNKLFMINGAQTIEKQGILSLYEFKNNSWVYLKDVELDEGQSENSYMVECPNYFQIKDKEYVFACFEQDAPLVEGSHFVKYREVKIDEKGDFSFLSDLKKIDLGFDFYAPQVFANVKDRVIMLGWLGNSKSNPFPPELTTWSNNLTIPRQLTTKNNQLYQYPIKEIDNLRENEITSSNNVYKYDKGIVEIVSDNINNKDFSIYLKSENKELKISNYNKNFVIDRSNMDYNDIENLPPKIDFNNLEIESLRILVDRSCIEIFVNEGQQAISVKFFIKNHNIVDIENLKASVFQLKPYKYKWNNIIFENKLKEV
ncbi:sucrose-6-phosphate hydrolase [Spiroplasma litorale]|uniref:beta-fructofuranosidase n=1 Tax=Spiroplasma litorale TaxID=216942 RepID=A0A0K1W180_9MOLU|nr:glycoside hydrolase family 32 protein [Spiroplasma litorale]AKX34080.1 sucrose-6-phosphate hydrolase [Spiroplasma litorale]